MSRERSPSVRNPVVRKAKIYFSDLWLMNPSPETNKPPCDSCRVFGSAVFFTSGVYMLLECVRSSKQSLKIVYAISASALAGLGSYRLMKPLTTSD